GEGADQLGFQVTFFRSRTLHPQSNPSRFAPRQLMFAHAALALPGEGQLLHAEVAGRAGPAGALFDTTNTALALSGWSMQRTAVDHYKILIPTEHFTLELAAFTALAPVLRGDDGFSLKGPTSQFASYYYSRPQLSVSARVTFKKSSGSLGVFIEISGVQRGMYDFALDVALSNQAHDNFTDFQAVSAIWPDPAAY
ncbi:MAG: carotenoid 1,2-hydratase, partial [Pseudomonadota bacterium]